MTAHSFCGYSVYTALIALYLFACRPRFTGGAKRKPSYGSNSNAGSKTNVGSNTKSTATRVIRPVMLLLLPMLMASC